jgi:hypothetical protein
VWSLLRKRSFIEAFLSSGHPTIIQKRGDPTLDNVDARSSEEVKNPALALEKFL